MTNFISISIVKSARIEIVDGVGESSGVFGETIEATYNDNADSYIDEVRYPVDVIDLLLTRREEIESFRVSTYGNKIYTAYDIGGEYLLVKGDFNEYAIFSIDSNI